MPVSQNLMHLPEELKGVQASGEWSFEQIFRMSQVFHASGLFADITDAAQAFVKIQKGLELHLPPMAAMTAFDIIQKRLFVKPWAIAALINACGYGSYRVVEQNAERCIIHFARKYARTGWQECPPVSYTIAEATAQGLVSRSPHWKSSPAHMLYQRCMGRGGQMYFPELLAGVEAPPETAPISQEKREQNVIELFGEGIDPTLPAPQERREKGQQTRQEAAGATIIPQDDSRGASGRQEPVGDPERPQKEGDDQWRNTLFHLAADTREFLDGTQTADMVVRVAKTCDEGLRLAENADTPRVQGEACIGELRKLGEQLSGQQRLV